MFKSLKIKDGSQKTGRLWRKYGKQENVDVNGWQIHFDSGLTGTIIGLTKKCGDWTIAVRSRGIFILRKREEYKEIRSENNNLATDFAKYISGEDSSKQKIKKELTILVKLGKLYGIDSMF